MELAGFIPLGSSLRILALSGTELTKILGCLRRDIRKELHFYTTERLACHSSISLADISTKAGSFKLPSHIPIDCPMPIEQRFGRGRIFKRSKQTIGTLLMTRIFQARRID